MKEIPVLRVVRPNCLLKKIEADIASDANTRFKQTPTSSIKDQIAYARQEALKFGCPFAKEAITVTHKQ